MKKVEQDAVTVFVWIFLFIYFVLTAYCIYFYPMQALFFLAVT
jgi:hypothetical protein